MPSLISSAWVGGFAGLGVGLELEPEFVEAPLVFGPHAATAIKPHPIAKHLSMGGPFLCLRQEQFHRYRATFRRPQGLGSFPIQAFGSYLIAMLDFTCSTLVDGTESLPFDPEAATDEPASSPALFDPVPVRYRRDGWTPEKQREFVEALADTGLEMVSATCLTPT